jgi:hypothetical protein
MLSGKQSAAGVSLKGDPVCSHQRDGKCGWSTLTLLYVHITIYHSSGSSVLSNAHIIRKVHKKQERIKLNGTHQLLAYADEVNRLGDNIDIEKKNTENLFDSSK